MRKMISFKIENLPAKQRRIVDEWANGQANIQQSLANIIMHVVEFTGNADVMDFDVQRKLHMIFVNNETPIQSPKNLVPEERSLQASETSNIKNDVITQATELFGEDEE